MTQLPDVPTTSLELAHEHVLGLIADFDAHRDKFLAPSYQEAEVRKDFIDPLLEALGWDVLHRHQKNPWEQEVKVERSVNVALAQKKADYAFTLAPNFRDVRFYVEAKKPSIDLARSVDAHFQTVRYGWSAGTPLALLTDFEQLVVLDCRRKPHVETVLDHAHLRFDYREFRDITVFAKFYWLFSREAHATGAFERYVEQMPKAKGGAKQRNLFQGGYQAVDESFLAELEEHREALAKIFKKAKATFDSETLTEITQRTIDRLVFLRFLEDKVIETEFRIEDLGKRRNAWVDFIEASRRLDAIYNGAVFKAHAQLDDPHLAVDSEAFGDICERLSHLNSPYDFNAIPIHILGSIYERFLGKVIVATDKRVRIVEKPEVRKAGGVFYTPEYVVRHIVEQTVGHRVEGKEPKEVWSQRFADIACGSGSFLLGVYDFLLTYLERWYNDTNLSPDAKEDRKLKAKNHGCVLDENGHWRLGLKLRRKILVDCVYGVDIDRQAVEVSQLSLYLKLLENESAVTARQFIMELGGGKAVRLLPDLSKNIVCGNSLVEWDGIRGAGLDEAEERSLNPLSFVDEFPGVMRSGGFDAIVGNPPYEVVEKERNEASWPHDAFIKAIKGRAYYGPAFGGKLNLFRFFLVRASKLTKRDGKLGMIVPMSILADISCAPCRVFLVSQLDDLQADCFPQKDVASKRIFRDAKLSTAILMGALSSGEHRKQILMRVFPENRFEHTPRVSKVLLSDMELLDPANLPIPLVSDEQLNLCRAIHRRADVNRIKDVPWLRVNRGEINQTVYKAFITDNPRHTRLLKGVEIARYRLREKLSQGHRQWFDEKKYLTCHSGSKLSATRRIATQRITGVDERLRVVATIVDPIAYFADSTNSIVSTAKEHSLEYVLGILNSKLIQWRFKLTSTNNNVGTNELEALPLRVIDFGDPLDRRRHALLTSLVKDLIAAAAAPAIDSRALELQSRKMAGLDRQIDTLVYELYGLTEDNIRTVEATLTPAVESPGENPSLEVA